MGDGLDLRCFFDFLPFLISSSIGRRGLLRLYRSSCTWPQGPPPLPTSAFHLTVLTPAAPPTTSVDVRQSTVEFACKEKEEKNEMKGSCDVVPLGFEIGG